MRLGREIGASGRCRKIIKKLVDKLLHLCYTMVIGGLKQMFTYRYVSYKKIEIGFYHQSGEFQCLHVKTTLDEAKRLVDFLNAGVI